MVFALPLLFTSSENDFLSSAMETTFPETALGCADCCPCWGRDENGWANAGNAMERSAVRDPSTRNLQHMLPATLKFIGVPPEVLMGRRNGFRHDSLLQRHKFFTVTYAHQKRFS
jgi:hypothetical protein